MLTFLAGYLLSLGVSLLLLSISRIEYCDKPEVIISGIGCVGLAALVLV